MDGKILLADEDPEYGRALARAVMNSQNGFAVTVTSLKPRGKRKIGAGNAFQDYDLILLGGYPEEAAESLNRSLSGGGRIVMLTDYTVESLTAQAEKEGDHFWYLYKYGKASDMISGLSYLIGMVTGKRSLLRRSSAPLLIGFYSVGGGAGKTVVALGTARELSRYHDKRVLYLSFEEVPAVELLFQNNPDGRNIGDYLYHLLIKGNEALCSRPEAFTFSDDYGVETFYPSKGRNDLNDLKQEELLSFLKIISDSGRYDYIAVELKSDLAEETLFLMEQCAKIILIRNDDPVSEFKNRKFIAYMEKLSVFRQRDRFLLVVNRADCPGSGWDGSGDSRDPVRIVRIEKDENSFRFASNRLDIDISHIFGVGIKKIAEEIISAEAGKENRECMVSCVP
jgi:cellulose biosynthesis protein BcsQ